MLARQASGRSVRCPGDVVLDIRQSSGSEAAVRRQPTRQRRHSFYRFKNLVKDGGAEKNQPERPDGNSLRRAGTQIPELRRAGTDPIPEEAGFHSGRAIFLLLGTTALLFLGYQNSALFKEKHLDHREQDSLPEKLSSSKDSPEQETSSRDHDIMNYVQTIPVKSAILFAGLPLSLYALYRWFFPDTDEAFPLPSASGDTGIDLPAGEDSQQSTLAGTSEEDKLSSLWWLTLPALFVGWQLVSRHDFLPDSDSEPDSEEEPRPNPIMARLQQSEESQSSSVEVPKWKCPWNVGDECAVYFGSTGKWHNDGEVLEISEQQRKVKVRFNECSTKQWKTLERLRPRPRSQSPAPIDAESPPDPKPEWKHLKLPNHGKKKGPTATFNVDQASQKILDEPRLTPSRLKGEKGGSTNCTGCRGQGFTWQRALKISKKTATGGDRKRPLNPETPQPVEKTTEFRMRVPCKECKVADYAPCDYCTYKPIFGSGVKETRGIRNSGGVCPSCYGYTQVIKFHDGKERFKCPKLVQKNRRRAIQKKGPYEETFKSKIYSCPGGNMLGCNLCGRDARVDFIQLNNEKLSLKDFPEGQRKVKMIWADCDTWSKGRKALFGTAAAAVGVCLVGGWTACLVEAAKLGKWKSRKSYSRIPKCGCCCGSVRNRSPVTRHQPRRGRGVFEGVMSQCGQVLWGVRVDTRR